MVVLRLVVVISANLRNSIWSFEFKSAVCFQTNTRHILFCVRESHFGSNVTSSKTLFGFSAVWYSFFFLVQLNIIRLNQLKLSVRTNNANNNLFR